MAGEITLEHDARGAWVVSLIGEHDLADQSDFQAAVDRAWPGGRVIIDLSESTFVDSTILMVIMQALRRAESDRVRVALVVPLASPADRLFVLSGFTRLLMPVGGSREEIFEAWEQ